MGEELPKELIPAKRVWRAESGIAWEGISGYGVAAWPRSGQHKRERSEPRECRWVQGEDKERRIRGWDKLQIPSAQDLTVKLEVWHWFKVMKSTREFKREIRAA